MRVGREGAGRRQLKRAKRLLVGGEAAEARSGLKPPRNSSPLLEQQASWRRQNVHEAAFLSSLFAFFSGTDALLTHVSMVLLLQSLILFSMLHPASGLLLVEIPLPCIAGLLCDCPWLDLRAAPVCLPRGVFPFPHARPTAA
jgi:hypothetical protein